MPGLIREARDMQGIRKETRRGRRGRPSSGGRWRIASKKN